MEKQPLRCILLHSTNMQDITKLEHITFQLEGYCKHKGLIFGLVRVGILFYIIIDSPYDETNKFISQRFDGEYILIDTTEAMLQGEVAYRLNNPETRDLKVFFENIIKAGQTLRKQSGSFAATIQDLQNQKESENYLETLSIPKAIDTILDKIGTTGFESLSDQEKEFLNKHTK